MNRRTFLATLPIVAVSGYSASKLTDSNNSVYEVSEFSFDFETEIPEYIILLERVASQVGDEESVVHVQDLSSESEDIVKEVIERRRYETEQVPSEVESASSNYEYVQCDECERGGRYFDISVVNTQIKPQNQLKFFADVADKCISISDPADIELGITNPSSRPMTVYSGVIPPFGVLTADIEAESQNLTLWNDEYAKNEGVSTDFGVVTGQMKQEISTVLQPREKQVETYQIRLRDYLPFVRTKDTPPTQFALNGKIEYSLGSTKANLDSEYVVRFNVI